MRIRKRAVPLPLSLLSPAPFSSPDLHHHRPVQLPSSLPSDPPDQPLKASQDAKMNNHLQSQESGSNLNPSQQSDSGAVQLPDNGAPMASLPSSHPKVEGRWCDGDKAIPLKKRKASFEMNGMVIVAGGELSKMKSKTNKNCPFEKDPEKGDDDDFDGFDNDDDDDFDDDENQRKRKRKGKKGNSNIGAKSAKTIKKKKRGGSVMEGSRCSRVNGRGWRCMQPTLVGYSLCDHHLGKGRLRSMSSVRALSTKTITTDRALLPPSPPPRPDPDGQNFCNIAEPPKHDEITIYDNNDDDDWKRPISAGNGRKRIGMVKARSLSSLLCLPDTTTSTYAVKIGANEAT